MPRAETAAELGITVDCVDSRLRRMRFQGRLAILGMLTLTLMFRAMLHSKHE